MSERCRWTQRCLLALAGIALLAGWPGSGPAGAAKPGGPRPEIDPADPVLWQERYDLDRLGGKPGLPSTRQVMPDSFGWFVYRTVVDPGPSFRGDVNPWFPNLVGRRVHAEFAGLTADLKACPEFLRGMLALWRHADYLARLRGDLRGWGPGQGPAGPVTAAERSELRSIGLQMCALAADPHTPSRARDAAALLAALTTGGEAVDTVSVPDLERVCARRPQGLAGLTNAYYLFVAFEFRGREDEPKAIHVATGAVRTARAEPWLGDIDSLSGLRNYLTYMRRFGSEYAPLPSGSGGAP